MKIVNIMNFVRRIDEREENSTERMLSLTSEQLKLVNKYSLNNTFLLQYDALCDPDFVALFKNHATDKTELGLWYEIVEPLTSACSMPYRSEMGWKWDWHIVPGYAMAYELDERERLIDEAMRKFHEIFGYYPRTVAAWVIDTHTLNHLAKKYSISAVAICRDQANTDAYTLRGGYFNQAYYPSKNNIFTPAQSNKTQINIPVFRLLGPCPIHNYDNNKYSSEYLRSLGRRSSCFTLEPCWYMGSNENAAKWLFDCFFSNESLGFSYAQIGQENSFIDVRKQVLSGMQMQIEMLLERKDVRFEKMGDTGELFKELYPEGTGATSVVATDNFDDTDVQSVYYDCKNYTANLFRYEDKVFIRSLYLFDDGVEDIYLHNVCTTFDAVFENLPIVDTADCPEHKKGDCGLIIDAKARPFEVKKLSDGVLRIDFGSGNVTFFEDRMEIAAPTLVWHKDSIKAAAVTDEYGMSFEYKGNNYRLDIQGATMANDDSKTVVSLKDEKIILYPKKAKACYNEVRKTVGI